MLARAIPLGKELIAAEADLDALFASGEPSPEAVETATARIGDGPEAFTRLVERSELKIVINPSD